MEIFFRGVSRYGATLGGCAGNKVGMIGRLNGVAAIKRCVSDFSFL